MSVDRLQWYAINAEKRVKAVTQTLDEKGLAYVISKNLLSYIFVHATTQQMIQLYEETRVYIVTRQRVEREKTKPNEWSIFSDSEVAKWQQQ